MKTRITGTLREDRRTFSIISHSFLLRMKSISDKRCRETRNTHFTFNNFFFDIRVVYEIKWKKCCRAGRATVDNMAHARCMPDT